MQTTFTSPAQGSSARTAALSQGRAFLVSTDRALVGAARRVFVCSGFAVSVYPDLESCLAATSPTARRGCYLVVDTRGEPADGVWEARLAAFAGRNTRILLVAGSREVPAASKTYTSVLVHGDYAPVSSVLQGWLAGRAGGQERVAPGLLTIDDEAHEVFVGGRRLPLRPTEHALLRLFFEHPHHLFSRADLLRLLWGEQTSVELRTVDVHIMRLRKVLRAHGLDGFVETVFGFGYRANHDVLERAAADGPPTFPAPSPSTSAERTES